MPNDKAYTPDSNKIRIGITGANGFVGQALCQLLLNEGYRPIAITRQPFRSQGIENHVVSDFTDQKNISKALQDCLAVVALASQTHTGAEPSKSNLARYRKNNLDTAVSTFQAASDAGVKRFVYLSSIKVNGEGTHGRPFTADSMPHPVDAYGISKNETEQALRQLASNTKTELTIIRSPLVYGAQVKGNLKLLKSAIEKGIPLPFASLRNKRDLIALPVLCDLITTCIEHPNAANQLFLAADGIPRSTPEIIELLHLRTHKNPILFPFPKALLQLGGVMLGKQAEASRIVGDLEIDISHTCKALNWHPTLSS